MGHMFLIIVFHLFLSLDELVNISMFLCSLLVIEMLICDYIAFLWLLSVYEIFQLELFWLICGIQQFSHTQKVWFRPFYESYTDSLCVNVVKNTHMTWNHNGLIWMNLIVSADALDMNDLSQWVNESLNTCTFQKKREEIWDKMRLDVFFTAKSLWFLNHWFESQTSVDAVTSETSSKKP